MNHKKGFTLVEVIAVIVILALLMVLVVPNISNSSKNAKEKTYKTKVSLIESSAVFYGQDNYGAIVSTGIKDEEGIVTKEVYVYELIPEYLTADNEEEGKMINDPRNPDEFLDDKVITIKVNTKSKKVTATFTEG